MKATGTEDRARQGVATPSSPASVAPPSKPKATPHHATPSPYRATASIYRTQGGESGAEQAKKLHRQHASHCEHRQQACASHRIASHRIAPNHTTPRIAHVAADHPAQSNYRNAAQRKPRQRKHRIIIIIIMKPYLRALRAFPTPLKTAASALPNFPVLISRI